MGFDTNVYVEVHMLNETPQAVKQNHPVLHTLVQLYLFRNNRAVVLEIKIPSKQWKVWS